MSGVLVGLSGGWRSEGGMCGGREEKLEEIDCGTLAEDLSSGDVDEIGRDGRGGGRRRGIG